MNNLIHLLIFHYIYRKLNTYMKIIYILLLSGFIIYQVPNMIMDIITMITLIDIFCYISYQMTVDDIYLTIRNNMIVLYIIWIYINILPDEYRLGTLLQRYTVHRYGLID